MKAVYTGKFARCIYEILVRNGLVLDMARKYFEDDAVIIRVDPAVFGVAEKDVFEHRLVDIDLMMRDLCFTFNKKDVREDGKVDLEYVTQSAILYPLKLSLNSIYFHEDLPQQESALASQVGGSHYKNYAIQPIEYIMENGLDYLQGNVVKYVTRFKDKNGVEDLKKAAHYLQIMIERETAKNVPND